MTAFSRLRRAARIVAILLAASSFFASLNAFAAARVPVSETTPHCHSSGHSPDNKVQVDAGNQQHSKHDGTHKDCCDNNCECPFAATTVALLPAFPNSFGFASERPEPSSILVFDGRHWPDVLKPPI